MAMLQPTIYQFDAIMAIPNSDFPNPEKSYPAKWIKAMKSTEIDMSPKEMADLAYTLNNFPLTDHRVEMLLRDMDARYFLDRSIVGPEPGVPRGNAVADLPGRKRYIHQEIVMMQAMTFIETSIVGPLGVS
jgi:hypothetical protein